MLGNKGDLRGYHEDDALEIGKTDFSVFFLPQSLGLGVEMLAPRAGITGDGKCLLEIRIHLRTDQRMLQKIIARRCHSVHMLLPEGY